MAKPINKIDPDTVAKQMISYFSKPVFEKKQVYVKGKLVEGKSPTEYPTIIDFCSEFNIDYYFLMNLLHPKNRKRVLKLHLAHEFAKKQQEKIIVQNALTNRFNPVFSIFALKNIAGWRDSQDLNIKGSTWSGLIKDKKK